MNSGAFSAKANDSFVALAKSTTKTHSLCVIQFIMRGRSAKNAIQRQSKSEIVGQSREVFQSVSEPNLTIDLVNTYFEEFDFPIITASNQGVKQPKNLPKLQLKNFRNLVCEGVCVEVIFNTGFSFCGLPVSRRKASYMKSINDMAKLSLGQAVELIMIGAFRKGGSKELVKRIKPSRQRRLNHWYTEVK